LKFLHRLLDVRNRNFNSKNGTKAQTSSWSFEFDIGLRVRDLGVERVANSLTDRTCYLVLSESL